MAADELECQFEDACSNELTVNLTLNFGDELDGDLDAELGDE